MKTRKSVSIVVLILAVMIVIGSCATNRKAISDEDFFKAWSGTWINTDLRASDWTPQKIVNYANGTQDRYTTPQMPKECTHPFTLIDSWKDSEGNIWYKATFICPRIPPTYQEYGKISVSNNTYELIYYEGTKPIEQWDPDNPKYYHMIYYRQ